MRHALVARVLVASALVAAGCGDLFDAKAPQGYACSSPGNTCPPGQQCVPGERHQRAARHRLRVRDVLHLGHDAEHEPRWLQRGAPRGAVARGEHKIQRRGQSARVPGAILHRSEARIVQRRALQRAAERLPAPLVGHDRQDQPLAVGAAVMVAQRMS